ncbi:MAG TPA: response regulator transcription factor [Anaerolineae bacterium]|nr:response regulator transcription factor [Anaerolineae bacterium]
MTNQNETITVIIVDDNPKFRDFISDVINHTDNIDLLGIAENGDDGFRMARQLTPNVVIMDINMPGIDGIATARAILKTVQTRILLISAEQTPDFEWEQNLVNASGFLEKPFQADQLINSIREIHNRSLV